MHFEIFSHFIFSTVARSQIQEEQSSQKYHWKEHSGINPAVKAVIAPGQ